MPGIEKANGRRPAGLSHLLLPTLSAAAQPKPEELDFDLEAALAAVVPLTSQVPEDAFTAPFLGTDREGSGVLIDEHGLVLTIGYLVVEAETVNIITAEDTITTADVVAYDYDSGFGLLRAFEPPQVKPLTLGSSQALAAEDSVIIAARGGLGQTIEGRVVAKREFAGYWEYLLDEAIFTTPPHPNWSGAALLGDDGALLGIGSLFLEDVGRGSANRPGNMFVPIDLLKPVLPEMLATGRTGAVRRPWLGVFTTDLHGQMVVSGLAPEGPAELAGMQPGDIVVRVGGEQVSDIADMYRRIWSIGSAGVDVPLTVLREGTAFDLVVHSTDRDKLLKQPLRQ